MLTSVPAAAFPSAPSGARAGLALLLLAGAVLGLPGSAGRRRLHRLSGAERARPRRLPVAALTYLVAAGAGFLLLGPAGAVCACGAAWFVRRRIAARRDAARHAGAAAELADALARITDELRTGAHPAAALAGQAHDGPLARALLEPAAAAARIGEPVPAALRRAAGGPAGRDVERIAAAWELADRHGAPLADLLGGLLDDIRWRIAHGARVRAQLAGPRATASVLTALPLAGIGLGQLMGIAPLTVLRSGLHGPVLLAVGVLLTAAGTAWSDRILRAAVPS
ncbi:MULTISPECIES: type II secretion system F family protein [unclassified Pseudonocardia]|uniref:type II secretion system F family protein n=1 Tax=unclassified Pseudonocardia TaxID=2619320 RepID=UPI000760EC79|nr:MULTISPECIES: type II secretion system F family protein [unclassified Pseudonocardia]